MKLIVRVVISSFIAISALLSAQQGRAQDKWLLIDAVNFDDPPAQLPSTAHIFAEINWANVKVSRISGSVVLTADTRLLFLDKELNVLGFGNEETISWTCGKNDKRLPSRADLYLCALLGKQ
jgi:hypothetical protein